MGIDYALVHLKYNIPLAVVLTLLYRPLFTRIDRYKLGFNIVVAVLATTPWDSYLIRRKVWTYPSNVVIGPTLFSIPAEEYFFFVIQTYITGMLYLILSKPVFMSLLVDPHLSPYRLRRALGSILICLSIITGITLLAFGGKGLYLGLILTWAGPFALLLWNLAHQFLIKLPLSSTLLTITLPTCYLWVIDTFELRKGTWTIQSGTKLGFQLWDGLEVEEAIFFLVTNILIVFGMVAFDNAFAIIVAFPDMFPETKYGQLPTPITLIKALLISNSLYNKRRLEAIHDAVSRLQGKSRSFYLASAAFPPALRLDLTLLYSFCRMADDLIDESETDQETQIDKLKKYLDYISMPTRRDSSKNELFQVFLRNVGFSNKQQLSLEELPPRLSYEPLYKLLDGFRTDLTFKHNNFPIRTKHELELYAEQVAGTVAQMVLELVYRHCPSSQNMSPEIEKKSIIHCGNRMGIALQYVNIARDIATDAAMGRVYLPNEWLKAEGLEPKHVLKWPKGERMNRLRKRMLVLAFAEYEEARKAIELLPREARAPIRVAVESYMEIGRVLGEGDYIVKRGRATVPKWRRLRIAWKAL